MAHKIRQTYKAIIGINNEGEKVLREAGQGRYSDDYNKAIEFFRTIAACDDTSKADSHDKEISSFLRCMQRARDGLETPDAIKQYESYTEEKMSNEIKAILLSFRDARWNDYRKKYIRLQKEVRLSDTDAWRIMDPALRPTQSSDPEYNRHIGDILSDICGGGHGVSKPDRIKGMKRILEAVEKILYDWLFGSSTINNESTLREEICRILGLKEHDHYKKTAKSHGVDSRTFSSLIHDSKKADITLRQVFQSKENHEKVDPNTLRSECRILISDDPHTCWEKIVKFKRTIEEENKGQGKKKQKKTPPPQIPSIVSRIDNFVNKLNEHIFKWENPYSKGIKDYFSSNIGFVSEKENGIIDQEKREYAKSYLIPAYSAFASHYKGQIRTIKEKRELKRKYDELLSDTNVAGAVKSVDDYIAMAEKERKDLGLEDWTYSIRRKSLIGLETYRDHADLGLTDDKLKDAVLLSTGENWIDESVLAYFSDKKHAVESIEKAVNAVNIRKKMIRQKIGMIPNMPSSFPNPMLRLPFDERSSQARLLYQRIYDKKRREYFVVATHILLVIPNKDGKFIKLIASFDDKRFRRECDQIYESDEKQIPLRSTLFNLEHGSDASLPASSVGLDMFDRRSIATGDGLEEYVFDPNDNRDMPCIKSSRNPHWLTKDGGKRYKPEGIFYKSNRNVCVYVYSKDRWNKNGRIRFRADIVIDVQVTAKSNSVLEITSGLDMNEKQDALAIGHNIDRTIFLKSVDWLKYRDHFGVDLLNHRGMLVGDCKTGIDLANLWDELYSYMKPPKRKWTNNIKNDTQINWALRQIMLLAIRGMQRTKDGIEEDHILSRAEFVLNLYQYPCGRSRDDSIKLYDMYDNKPNMPLGGLSSERIKLASVAVDLYRAIYMRRNPGERASESIKEDTTFKKLKNKEFDLRQERTKKKTNALLAKLCEQNKNGDVRYYMEDISFDKDNSRAKKNHRRLHRMQSILAPVQTRHMVEHQGLKYGIKMKAINPFMTSHMDPAYAFSKWIEQKDHLCCRMNEVDLYDKEGVDRAGNVFQMLVGNQDQGILSVLYRRRCEQMLRDYNSKDYREIIKNAKNQGRTKILVPSRSGKWVESSLGTIEADKMASINIMLSGVVRDRKADRADFSQVENLPRWDESVNDGTSNRGENPRKSA